MYIWNYIQNWHGKSSIQQEESPLHQETGLDFRQELLKFYIWGTALYDTETWTIRKVDQIYLQSSEMRCWRRMEKSVGPVVWERNEDVWHRVMEEKNILHKIERRKTNWIGHNLRRNCLLKYITEGKIGRIEVTGRRGMRSRQLLNDLTEKRGNWKLKEEAIYFTLWRIHGPVVRQTTEWMNEWLSEGVNVIKSRAMRYES